jgi:hypothetical protein
LYNDIDFGHVYGTKKINEIMTKYDQLMINFSQENADQDENDNQNNEQRLESIRNFNHILAFLKPKLFTFYKMKFEINMSELQMLKENLMYPDSLENLELMQNYFFSISNKFFDKNAITNIGTNLYLLKGLWQRILLIVNMGISTDNERTKQNLINLLKLIKFGACEEIEINHSLGIFQNLYECNLHSVLLCLLFEYLNVRFKLRDDHKSFKLKKTNIVPQSSAVSNSLMMSVSEEIITDMLKIDWEVVIEILLHAESVQIQQNLPMMNFEFGFTHIWKQMFQNFFDQDAFFSNTMEDTMFFISKTDMDNYSSGKLQYSKSVAVLPNMANLHQNYLKFRLKDYILKRPNCYWDFYQENILKDCPLSSSCKHRINVYLCALCETIFCSDCHSEFLSKKFILIFKIKFKKII